MKISNMNSTELAELYLNPKKILAVEVTDDPDCSAVEILMNSKGEPLSYFVYFGTLQEAKEFASGLGRNNLVRIKAPDEVEPVEPAPGGPDDDEIIPFDANRLEGRVDLIKAAQLWTKRSRRNIFMIIDDEGRKALVWAKGSMISDEEYERQNHDPSDPVAGGAFADAVLISELERNEGS